MLSRGGASGGAVGSSKAVCGVKRARIRAFAAGERPYRTAEVELLDDAPNRVRLRFPVGHRGSVPVEDDRLEPAFERRRESPAGTLPAPDGWLCL